MIDTHCHVLPGVDDGPVTMAEAVAMCFASAADGVEVVIATPHQRHQMWPNRDGAAITALVGELQREVGDRPRIVAGAEIRVDSELLADLDAFEASGLLSLAGSRYLLLEFPNAGGPEPRPLLHELLVAGWRPILAHAERVPRWTESPEALAELVELGAYVQVTAGSVLGRFGRRARSCCTWLFDRNLVHFLGSDAHDTEERPPGLSLAHEAITRGWGASMADRLTRLNPSDILANQRLPEL
jgi:protein-tyrosine phosphatase